MKKSGEEIMQIHGDGRVLRSSNRKDRHSKVYTSKGPRERRVRLAADTAIQFYDVQDRLGYDRPSKAVDWLIQKAKAAIDNLAELPPPTRVLEPASPPLVYRNPSKLPIFEPQNLTFSPGHIMQSASMHNNELCLSIHSLGNNLSTQIRSTLQNPISSGSSPTNFEESYPRVMSWNGDVDGNRSVQSRFEYDFNLQQDSMLGRNSVYSGGEPVKNSILPDFHTWDEQQLRTISRTHFAHQGQSWGGL